MSVNAFRGSPCGQPRDVVTDLLRPARGSLPPWLRRYLPKLYHKAIGLAMESHFFLSRQQGLEPHYRTYNYDSRWRVNPSAHPPAA
jgi:hypothetical protein